MALEAFSRRSVRRLVAVVTLAVTAIAMPSLARGDASVSAVAPDTGWRGYGVIGTPSILGLGLGYKVRRIELLVNGGGFAYYHILVGVLEASLNVDLVRWPGGSAYVGASYALQHAPAVERDCGGDTTACDEDDTAVATTAKIGPRLGARTVLAARSGLGGPCYLDVSAGPMVESCKGECSAGAEPGFAGVVRLVLQF